MENGNETPKKSGVGLYFVLAAVIIIPIGIIMWSLFHFNIIRIEKTEPEKPYEPKYIDIAYDDLGSAKFFDGKTAVVAVFVSDTKYRWDFSLEGDKALRKELLGYLPIACEWLAGQGEKYGRKLDFAYAADENDGLLYAEAEVSDVDILELYGDRLRSRKPEYEWQLISENVDSDAVKAEYGCDNIVYALFFNTTEECEDRPAAHTVYKNALAEPYEFMWLPVKNNGSGICPATIAHEMIHLFGAPDLYGVDIFGHYFDVPQGFPEYCTENFPTDIMLSTRDGETGELLGDRITREITDITAYYIGWLDEPPFDVDSFRMVHSQFDKK